MIPKRSPFGLLQEDVAPNEWLSLVVCVMLNCTSRKQVEKIFPEFIRRWSRPEAFLRASRDDVVALCAPLGFANRRTDRLFALTSRYLEGGWVHAQELPGIGTYGARSWEMFCHGIIGEDPPKDGALGLYWHWRTARANDDTGV